MIGGLPGSHAIPIHSTSSNMNSTTQVVADVASDDSPYRPTQEDSIVYRSVCKTAVLALVFGIFGLCTFLSSVFLIFPLVGLIFSFLAFLNFRRYPDELLGKAFFRIGLGLSLVCFVGGIGFHAYSYATEVPEGYERISYRMLRPKTGSSKPFTNSARELDGKRVFIKGYVRPSDKKNNLQNFILVGDFGSCCFGASPEVSDVIAVKLEGDLRVNYSWRLRHIAGVFRFTPQSTRTDDKEVPQVIYRIDADYLK